MCEKKTTEKDKKKVRELPRLIAGGKAYKMLLFDFVYLEKKNYKYTTMLYAKTNDFLSLKGLSRRDNMLYKYFTNPEEHLNKALLERKKRNENQWTIIVNAMEEAAIQTIIEAQKEMEVVLKLSHQKHKEFTEFLIEYKKETNEQQK